MKPRGGARQGAGRKKGIPSKKTQETIQAAKELGLLPHEFLLAVAQNRLGDKVLLCYNMFGEPQYGKPDLKTQMRAAEAAAPYYAPRLAQIEQTVETNINYVIGSDPLSEEEFEAKYGIGVESTAETENIS